MGVTGKENPYKCSSNRTKYTPFQDDEDGVVNTPIFCFQFWINNIFLQTVKVHRISSFPPFLLVLHLGTKVIAPTPTFRFFTVLHFSGCDETATANYKNEMVIV